MASNQTIAPADKKKVLDLLKSIDIHEMVIPEEAKRKWYKFGAYDALRMACEKVQKEL